MDLPVGALGEEIALLAAQLDAGTHRLLTCIRQFDVAEGWHRQGAQSCAHWLTWRIGLDAATAREKVRVARALGALPALDGALAAGRLSYAKVRAITRVATPETEARLVEMALLTTGAQMERICRRFRSLRTERLSEERAGQGEDLAATADGRGVQVRPLASGMVRLEVTLRPDEADLVMKAIEKARDELRALALEPARPVSLDVEVTSPVDPDGASAETPASVRAVPASGARREGTPASPPRVPRPARADGLLSMAEATLRMTALPGMTGGSDRPEGADIRAGRELDRSSGEVQPRWAGDRYRVLVHLSESLAGPEGSHEAYLEDGTLLAPEAFRRISCDAGLVPVVVPDPTSNAGGALDVGRHTRAIPTALRRALRLRDGGCCFPGCANHRFVHGHHIRHWAHGGETALHNLVLVCTFHHGLLHEGGFTLRQDPRCGAREWRDPQGRLIPEVPPPAFAEDERPNLLALGAHGVAVPLHGEVNACGWDGWAIDHAAVLDSLIASDSLFAAS